jgi:hypothetical protein
MQAGENVSFPPTDGMGGVIVPGNGPQIADLFIFSEDRDPKIGVYPMRQFDNFPTEP